MENDPSKLHERLGYSLFRDYGVAASRTTYTRLVINDELFGLYILVEQIDGRFTRYNFDDGGEGNLYKEVWPLYDDPNTYLDALETNEDEDPDVSPMLEFAADIEAATDETAYAMLEKWQDIPAMMRYLAVDRSIENQDGIMAWYCLGPWCFNHNYYWYQEISGERLWLIPWDLDHAFATSSWFEYMIDGWPEWYVLPKSCKPKRLWPGIGARPPACDDLIYDWGHTTWDLYVAAEATFLETLYGDIIGAAGMNGKTIRWWEKLEGSDAGDATDWDGHTVAEVFDGASFVRAVDLDQDGDPDVIGVARRNNTVRWWENRNSSGEGWLEHPLDDALQGAAGVAIGDLNGDSYLDIVAVASGSGEVVWYKNDLGTDADGDGFGAYLGDCNDADPSIYPGADETPYDGVDSNCDGLDPIDVDLDGYNGIETGDPAAPLDCDDTDPETYPGADEVADEWDNNCNGLVDEGLPTTDDDGDGFTDLEGDCDDGNLDIYPGADEYCDELDNDCNGVVDEGATTTFYVDQDADGFGALSPTLEACSVPAGYTSVPGDCDDLDPNINQEMAEICGDGFDNDCSGQDEVCVSPTPDGNITPAPAIDVNPTADDIVTPTPGQSVTPTPGTEVSSTPGTDITPTAGAYSSPTPAGGTTPTPVDNLTPTPVDNLTPTPVDGGPASSPNASPSPDEEVTGCNCATGEQTRRRGDFGLILLGIPLCAWIRTRRRVR